jgi:hypothetical protein
MFKGLVRHGNGGGSFKIAGLLVNPAIKARHPLRAFLFLGINHLVLNSVHGAR